MDPDKPNHLENTHAAQVRSEVAAKHGPLVRAGDATPEAGRKIMLFHVECVLAHEAGTRNGGDIESLHDMRVATRRLRSAFRMFRKPMGRALLDPFQEDIKWLNRSLGDVRDLDVSMAHMRKRRGKAPIEDRPIIDAILAEQHTARDAARAHMIECLDSERYRGLMRGLGEFLRSPGIFAGCPAAGEPLAKFAPRILRKRLKRVRAYRKTLQRADSQQLHALRIDCKHLRYAAEFVRSAYPKRLGKWINRVTKVQGVLGDIHDADVRVDTLTEFAEVHGGQADLALGVQRLIGFEQGRRAGLIERFYALWPKLSSKRFKRRLNAILAEPI